jgi:hypothetical protein
LLHYSIAQKLCPSRSRFKYPLRLGENIEKILYLYNLYGTCQWAKIYGHWKQVGSSTVRRTCSGAANTKALSTTFLSPNPRTIKAAANRSHSSHREVKRIQSQQILKYIGMSPEIRTRVGIGQKTPCRTEWQSDTIRVPFTLDALFYIQNS